MNLDKEIQDKINDSFRAMHRKTDAYIIEQLFSLISNGVIELTQTQMETKRLEDLDTNSLKLSTSKCVGLSFKGKEKIIELEAKNKQQEKLLIEACEVMTKFENSIEIRSGYVLEFKRKPLIKELLERKSNNN